MDVLFRPIDAQERPEELDMPKSRPNRRMGSGDPWLTVEPQVETPKSTDAALCHPKVDLCHVRSFIFLGRGCLLSLLPFLRRTRSLLTGFTGRQYFRPLNWTRRCPSTYKHRATQETHANHCRFARQRAEEANQTSGLQHRLADTFWPPYRVKIAFLTEKRESSKTIYFADTISRCRRKHPRDFE
jgi:hypothetical protein